VIGIFKSILSIGNREADGKLIFSDRT